MTITSQRDVTTMLHVTLFAGGTTRVYNLQREPRPSIGNFHAINSHRDHAQRHLPRIPPSKSMCHTGLEPIIATFSFQFINVLFRQVFAM